MRTIAFIAIVMVLVFATIVEAEKSKQCRALNGINYDIGEGYETTCNKFTCTKKTGSKGQQKIPKMVETATGTCCKYEGKQHLQGEEITLPSKQVLGCCKGYWIPFNITSSGQQPACDDDFESFSFTDLNRDSETHGGNWMGKVSDLKRLNELSIPGTHDTMAYQGKGATLWHKTQNQNLRQQLEMGVRFIDIRLKIRDGTLGSYHGNAYLDNDFYDVLVEIKWLLLTFPSETVLMRISSEGDDDAADFCSSVNQILRSFDITLWNSGSSTIWQGKNIPTLGDVRGKLVVLNWSKLPGCFGFKFMRKLLDNFEGGDNVEWKKVRRRGKRESTQEYTNFHEIEEIEGFQNQSLEKNVTTEYTKNLKKSGNELDRKFVPSESYMNELESFLLKVRTDSSYTNYMTYTYASAFDWRVHNERFASHVNQHLYTYFKKYPFDRIGVVVFDYINKWNSRMPKLIYERNYKEGCAIMYEDCDFNGGWLRLYPGASLETLNKWNWNDKASSYSVREGCTLTYWEHGYFSGKEVIARKARAVESCLVNGPLNSNWNNRISSVKCEC